MLEGENSYYKISRNILQPIQPRSTLAKTKPIENTYFVSDPGIQENKQVEDQ